MRYLGEDVRKLFKSDMRIVVDYLAEGDGYRTDRKIKHKAALIKMLKALSGEKAADGDIRNWLEECRIKEEDGVTVCELFDQYERRGRVQGRVEGRAEGRAEGEGRFAKLVQALMDSGRNDDVRKAASDQKYREQLYAEVNLA